MADVTKTVDIIFGAQDKVTTVAKKIDKSVKSLADGVDKVAAPFAKVADVVVAADAALAAMVVGGMALAINEAGKFGDSFKEISTLITETGADLGGFEEDILEYGRTSTQAYDQINQAVYSAISAGTDYADSLDLISQAEKLAVAGKADLNATTVLLASTLNAYGEEVSEAGRYSDVFFQTVKEGQTTLPELAQYLSQVSGIAANAGIPIETLAAAIATLTASGLPTSQAMTAIKAAISNIIKPASQARDMASQLGIQFNATALESQGFEGVLKAVYEATGGSAEQMAKLFGSTEALNAVMILAGKGSDKFADSMVSMASSAGATEEAFEKMEQTLGNINQRLYNNIKETLIRAGDELLESWEGVASGLGNLFEGISISIDSGAFDEIFEMVQMFGEDLKNYLTEVGDALPEAFDQVDFDELVSAFGELGEAVKGIFGDLDLTQPEDLAKAIQFAVDTIASLVSVTTGMVDSLQPIFQSIVEGVDAFNDLDSESKKTLGSISALAKTFTLASDAITSGVTAMTTAIQLIAGAQVVNAIGKLKEMGLTMAALGTGGSIAAVTVAVGGLAVGLGMLSDKLVDWMAQKDRAEQDTDPIPLLLELDSGNVLDVMTGIITDLEGNVVSVPVQFETDEDRTRREIAEHSALVKELLETDAPDAVINFVVETDEDQWAATLSKAIETIDPTIPITAELDEESTDEVSDGIERWTDDEGVKHFVDVGIEVEGTEDAEQKLSQVARDRIAEIKVQGDIDVRLAEIKASADTVQASFEWTAKVRIEEAKAQATALKAIFEALATEFKASSDVMSDLFALWGEVSKFDRSDVEKFIKEEMKMRERILDQQEDLINAQVAYMDAKTQALKRGDSLVKVDGEGLAPELEAFMWKILEAIQIRVNAEQAEFLLGI